MTSIDIIDEVQQNFVDGSYDTNANRAFPDVRDGLKPGQRAILWEMYTKKYTSDKPHVKSAKIDGGVAALWWPHGTVAIYETFARMSQPFSNNIPEIDFHGANGNIILGGDAIASDRYTEARLAKITEDGMLKSVNKNTVDMQLNFSEDEEWPKVLPAVFPRLLVNGAQGIGVSVANTWLPHNFQETADLILNYLKTDELAADEYYPDFPTGGTIVNMSDLAEINKTGKGKVVVEASYKIKGNEITFYEMPFQVYIEPVIDKIKNEIENGNLIGIKDVFNKSDKNQIALVVECQRGVDVQSVLDNIFAVTPLRSQYNANQNGIISKTPVLLNLQETIDVYVKHNLNCISREFEHDYNEANNRIEILQGLSRAIADIDEVISIIRNSENSVAAKDTLVEKYDLTERQAKAILDMKLAKLSKLDGIEIENELKEKLNLAASYAKVMSDEAEQKKVLANRLSELAAKYGSPRKTKVVSKTIQTASKSKSKEKVVTDVVISFNTLGYLRNTPAAQYRSNGSDAFKMKSDEMVTMFSNFGKLYRVAAGDIKTCGSADKGTPIGTIVKLEQGEQILSVFDNSINESKPYLMFAFSNGKVKKCEKKEFIGTTRNLKGLLAAKVGSDTIVGVKETNGCVVTLTTETHSINFMATDVRASGRGTGGVVGIKTSDPVLEMKITEPSKFHGSIQKRGGVGEKR